MNTSADALPTTTGDALLADILASPDDDTPRLVYADWLMDNGDPLRGEFIALQCQLAREEPGYTLDLRANWVVHQRSGNPKIVRAAELVRHVLRRPGGHSPDWHWLEFRRGFAEGLTAPFDEWAFQAAGLRERHPLLRRVLLMTCPMLQTRAHGLPFYVRLWRPEHPSWDMAPSKNELAFDSAAPLDSGKAYLLACEVEWPGIRFAFTPEVLRNHFGGRQP